MNAQTESQALFGRPAIGDSVQREGASFACIVWPQCEKQLRPKVCHLPCAVTRKFCISGSGAVHREMLADDVRGKEVLADSG